MSIDLAAPAAAALADNAELLAGLGKDPRLQLLSSDPPNAETPPQLLDQPLTPAERIFLRNSYPQPSVSPTSWELTIDGLVRRPLSISYAELLQRPASSYVAVLECAGNGRGAFAGAGGPAEGLQLGDGSVANAEWIGVPLALLLEEAGVKAQALQAECGSAGRTPFVRGVEVAKLQHDAMLAYALNGRRLPHAHGGPVRLVVPGWAGVSWVKWITRMTLISHESASPLNQERYVLYDESGAAYGKVRELAVKSLITSLADGAQLAAGHHELRGVAWSAGQGIAHVEIAVDDGRWQRAELGLNMGPRAWRPFSWVWEATPGRHTIAVRATDGRGERQPAQARFNRRGYLMNAIRRLAVTVS